MKHSKKNILICLFAICLLFASCNPDSAKQTPTPSPTPTPEPEPEPQPQPTPSYEPYKIFNDDGTLNSIQYFNEKGQFSKIENYYYVTEARYPNDYLRSIDYYQNGEENTYPVVFLREEYEHLNYDKTASEIVKKTDSSGTVIYEMSQKMKWAKMLENGTYETNSFPEKYIEIFGTINEEENKIFFTDNKRPNDHTQYFDIENTTMNTPQISHSVTLSNITKTTYDEYSMQDTAYRVTD